MILLSVHCNVVVCGGYNGILYILDVSRKWLRLLGIYTVDVMVVVHF